MEDTFLLHLRKLPKFGKKKYSGLVLDPESYSMRIEDRTIRLRKKEFALLSFFLRNKNRIINRNTLLENVWGNNCNPFTNTVDGHVV